MHPCACTCRRVRCPRVDHSRRLDSPLQGTSLKEAPAVIAEEQEDTVGARMPLMINATKGFSLQRAALNGVVERLGLKFDEHTLRIPLDGGHIDCAFYARRPLDVARYLYRFVTRAHCAVRELRDPSGGGRVYADAYSGTYAAQQQRRICDVDPRGVLLLLKLYADETPITKAMERCVYPMSVYNLALPLEAMRTHEQAMLLCFFGHFAPGLLASLSKERARRLRKALHRAAKRVLFAGCGVGDVEALVGTPMTGADGCSDNVFVRFAGLSMDCMEAQKWTQTLTNRTCWCCYTQTGDLHYPFLQHDARTRDSQLRLLERAWAAHPSNDAQRRAYLRPYGLHPEPNEALQLIGLDLFQGTPPPPLHIFYQGLVKKLFACTFCVIQRQVPKAAFTKLGKRIDAWLESLSSDCPWFKTSFPKGLSHFLYGAYVDENDPWASTVQFGKVASKHVYRDICRFWRLLVIDLFPECPQMLELFTDFFEYMELILRHASTDESLRVAEVHRDAWQTAAVRLFGKEEFEGMLKFHLPLHFAAFIKGRGSLPWWHDEDGEAQLRPNAKNLLARTNMAVELEAQLAPVVQRRDALRLVEHVLSQQLAAADGDDADGGAAAAPQLPAATAASSPTVLMGQRPGFSMTRRDVQVIHPELAQLEFAIRLHLHLAQAPENDECVHLRDMPTLASEVLNLRKGLRVLRWPASEPGAWRGGQWLHSRFQPRQVRGGAWRLLRRRGPAIFVAVRSGRALWYGELILCFGAAYRPPAGGVCDQQLCLVRWLQTAAKTAIVERRELTASESRGPFEVYRWSTHTGSYMRGHPAHSTPHYGVVDASQVRYRAPIFTGPAEPQGAPNPTFRLVTDMLRRF